MTPKIATCSYCSTRAALVLDRGRHELICASCGAPLHDMKALHKPAERARAHTGRARPMPPPHQDNGPERPVRKRRKPRRGFARKMLEEIWDVVEDIFD
ncbi:hypothetical protein [uncultured Roseovarius sp.]|uniref:hypothetical protein n=1 Tax=Roseovarius sp. TaxID=1486281 RepID=UPI0025E81F4F|nr:hypothetical protein [uncultured Roseovarius sp.]